MVEPVAVGVGVMLSQSMTDEGSLPGTACSTAGLSGAV